MTWRMVVKTEEDRITAETDSLRARVAALESELAKCEARLSHTIDIANRQMDVRITLESELAAERAKREEAEKERDETLARWSGQVVDRCEHPEDRWVCCSDEEDRSQPGEHEMTTDTKSSTTQAPPHNPVNEQGHGGHGGERVSGHTKGPWQKRLIEYEQGDQVGWSIEAGNGRGAGYIADVHMHAGAARDDARDEANADLVAAAPLMLEALELMSRRLDAWDRLKNPTPLQMQEGWAAIDDAHARVRAAIAKATTTQRSSLPPRTSLLDGDKEVAP